MSQARDQQRFFTVLLEAADWHQLMIRQIVLRSCPYTAREVDAPGWHIAGRENACKWFISLARGWIGTIAAL